MRYILVLTFILTINSVNAFSQSTNKGGTAGEYRFVQNADNVIKIIYKP